MNINYGCRNTAWHDYKCCETCWNQHPEAKQGEMFLGTNRYWELKREQWINEAKLSGFSQEQSEFLYNNYHGRFSI